MNSDQSANAGLGVIASAVQQYYNIMIAAAWGTAVCLQVTVFVSDSTRYRTAGRSPWRQFAAPPPSRSRFSLVTEYCGRLRPVLALQHAADRRLMKQTLKIAVMFQQHSFLFENCQSKNGSCTRRKLYKVHYSALLRTAYIQRRLDTYPPWISMGLRMLGIEHRSVRSRAFPLWLLVGFQNPNPLLPRRPTLSRIRVASPRPSRLLIVQRKLRKRRY